MTLTVANSLRISYIFFLRQEPTLQEYTNLVSLAHGRNFQVSQEPLSQLQVFSFGTERSSHSFYREGFKVA